MEPTTSNFSHLHFPLEEVIKATNNFDEKNVIGRGGLGRVYKGKLLRSGKLVNIAARRLDSKYKRDIEFWTEICALSSLKHENIVSLIGFCDEKGEKVIINKLEAKRSLEIYLSKPTLTWVQRLKICIGVARALSYLHYEDGRGYCVIHRNINSSTILLDDKFEPKLSGFEYSINQSLHRKDQVSITEAIGTTGYMDPAIEKTGGVTYKSDIYSFGAVLWEIFYMRKAFISDEFDRFLVALARFHYESLTVDLDLIKPGLYDQIAQMALDTFLSAAYSCSNDERAQRRDMISIVNELEKALELQLEYESLYKPNLERATSQLSHLRIKLADIKLATDNYSDTYRYFKMTYYDTYKAELEVWDKKNSSLVEEKNKCKHPKKRTTALIKRLYHEEYWAYGEEVTKRVGEDIFATNIEMLTTCKHRNIVILLGFCDEDEEKILIVEDASDGHLLEYIVGIRDKRILNWEKRLKICLDVAYGLKYLHHEMEDQNKVLNSTFTPKSIALDENLGAKIVEFGNSMLLPPNQDSLQLNSLRCTPPYTDPEYYQSNKLKRESDLYSFGVLMFEMLCGRMAYDKLYMNGCEFEPVYVARGCSHNGTLMEVIDPQIKEESDTTKRPNKDSINTFAEIANRCVAEIQAQRPTMKVVVEELEKLSLSFQTQCQGHSDQLVDGFDLTHENSEQPDYAVETSTCRSKTNQVETSTCINMKANLFEHLHIPRSDITLATDNFSLEYCILHHGHYYLYKAELEHFDHEKLSSVEVKNRSELPKKRSTVLIRRVINVDEEEKKLLFNDIEMNTTCNHPNIAALVGLCIEDFEMILVFENVHEFLIKYLSNKRFSIPTWSKRLRICLDVAYGLKYLHYEKEDQKLILHRWITSPAIVFDENFKAKFSNFHYSVFLQPNVNDHYEWPLSELTYHLDPDYEKTGKFKRESDVYSFGVLLFEIACGKIADDEIYTRSDEKGIAPVVRRCNHNGTLKQMIDPVIKEESLENKFTLYRGLNEDSLDAFLKVAVACVEITPDKRPTMDVVVEELEKALSYQENHKDSLRISLKDVQSATENFHEKHCVGHGGFGKVYKGKLPQCGHTIVAKRLDTSGGQGEKQFQNELQILSEYKHKNIINLVGYCAENDANIIVYEYAPRGSLDRYLSDTRLDWMKRLNICIDVATALDFLHRGIGKQATVIHRDIKIENILLMDEWNAKLADFGLSLITAIDKETDYVIDGACGTSGYVDPLYVQSSFLTKESDIYSFGVVLFEILCGRPTYVIRKQEGVYLPVFIKDMFEKGKQDEAVFGEIKAQIKPEALSVFQTIAYKCLHEKREDRPTAEQVVKQLKKAMDLQMSRGDGASSSASFFNNKYSE